METPDFHTHDNQLGAALPADRMSDILRLIARVEPLDVLLQKIVDTIAQAFNIRRVTLGVLDERTGMYCPRALHGFPQEKALAIKRHAYTLNRMKSDLREEFKIGRGCYYVRAEDQRVAYDDALDYIINPHMVDCPRQSPTDWHELDYIDFVLTDRIGNWIGWIEIDEPVDGKVPSRDVIERIRILADLAAIAIENSRMYDEAVSAMKDSQGYLDLIVHDIGNMVDPMVYYLNSMLSCTELDEHHKAQCVQALAIARSMRGLVDSVRKFSEIRAAENVPLVRMSLNEILKTCAAHVNRTFPDREISVNLSLPDREVEVLADNLVYELFMNLMNNAVKYTPRARVEIDISLREGYSAHTVSISDHGMGIPDEKKPLVFQRFAARPDGAQGTGLGLSIVSLLVNRYGGLVSVGDRVPGDCSQGTCFDVSFPKILSNTSDGAAGNQGVAQADMSFSEHKSTKGIRQGVVIDERASVRQESGTPCNR